MVAVVGGITHRQKLIVELMFLFDHLRILNGPCQDWRNRPDCVSFHA